MPWCVALPYIYYKNTKTHLFDVGWFFGFFFSSRFCACRKPGKVKETESTYNLSCFSLPAGFALCLVLGSLGDMYIGKGNCEGARNGNSHCENWYTL